MVRLQLNAIPQFIVWDYEEIAIREKEAQARNYSENWIGERPRELRYPFVTNSMSAWVFNLLKSYFKDS